MTFEPPQQLGRYELLSPLGSGGMAVVYRARLVGPGGAIRPVALKLIRPELTLDHELVLMFLDEVRVAMALTHRNIVQTFDGGEVDGWYYLVMELVEGCTLHELLCRLGDAPLPADLALFVGAEVCAALEYAHTFRPEHQGQPGVVLHRDISPGNVLLSREGDVKLADFGVAKTTGRLAVTRVNLVKGKLGYMAPEQACGEAGTRSDIFSMGAVLYEALTGRPIRESVTVESVRLGLLRAPPPRQLVPSLSEGLEATVMRCLAADPARRPQSAEALRRELAEEASRLVREGDLDPDPRARLRAFLAQELDAPHGAAAEEKAELIAKAMLAEVAAVPTDPAARPQAPSLPEIELSTAELVIEPPSLDGAQREPTGLVEQPTELVTFPETTRRWLFAPQPTRRGPLVAFGVAVLLAGGLLVLLISRPGSAPDHAVPPASPDLRADRVARRPDATPPRPAVDAAVAARPDVAPPRRPEVVTVRKPPVAHRPPPPPPRPTGFGTLNLNAVPWAHVYIDGEPRGETPLQGLRLSAGPHRVRLVNPEQRLSTTFSITIDADQTTSRVIQLRRPP